MHTAVAYRKVAQTRPGAAAPDSVLRRREEAGKSCCSKGARCWVGTAPAGCFRVGSSECLKAGKVELPQEQHCTAPEHPCTFLASSRLLTVRCNSIEQSTFGRHYVAVWQTAVLAPPGCKAEWKYYHFFESQPTCKTSQVHISRAECQLSITTARHITRTAGLAGRSGLRN